MIVTGAVNVGLVLAAMFVLGTAETFADTTTSTLLPMLVDTADLGVGNARLMIGHITANQLAGPPIGAALFAIGMAWPFVDAGVLRGARRGPRRRGSRAAEPPRPEVPRPDATSDRRGPALVVGTTRRCAR